MKVMHELKCSAPMSQPGPRSYQTLPTNTHSSQCVCLYKCVLVCVCGGGVSVLVTSMSLWPTDSRGCCIFSLLSPHHAGAHRVTTHGNTRVESWNSRDGRALPGQLVFTCAKWSRVSVSWFGAPNTLSPLSLEQLGLCFSYLLSFSVRFYLHQGCYSQERFESH